MSALLVGTSVAGAFSEGPAPSPSLVVIEFEAKHDFESLALRFYREIGATECRRDSQDQTVDEIKIAPQVAVAADQKRTLTVVVSGNFLSSQPSHASCLALLDGTSLLHVATLTSESGAVLVSSDVAVIAMELFELDSDFGTELSDEELREELLVFDMRHLDLLTRKGISQTLDAAECATPLDEGSSPDYLVCRKDLFVVDARSDEILVVFKHSGKLVTELRTAETLEHRVYRPLLVSEKAGWKKYVFKADSGCAVPAGTISIVDASGRRFEVPVAVGERGNPAPTGYLPDERPFSAAGRLTPFKANFTLFPGRDTDKVCLRLKHPSIILIGSDTIAVRLDEPKLMAQLSERATADLAARVRQWALGEGSAVRIEASKYWVSSKTVPGVDSSATDLVLVPVEWRRFKFEGRDREGAPLSFARWHLVPDGASEGVALDANATVPLYQIAEAGTYRLKPPNDYVFGHYEPVHPRVVIGTNDLADALLERKIVDVDLRARSVELKPSALDGLAPKLEVELNDGTLIHVVGEIGSGGAGDDRIVVLPVAGALCPQGTSELASCSATNRGCRRVCLVSSRTAVEPRHVVALKDLRAAAPVGLSSVNRSTLLDPRKRARFADLFSASSTDVRWRSFEQLFGHSRYGVDLHAVPSAVVVVRQRTGDGRCNISALQQSPVSDAFRIANGYARDGLEVWTDNGWTALSQVQRHKLTKVGSRHAYIVIAVHEMDLPVSDSLPGRGEQAKKSAWDSVFGSKAGQHEPELVSSGFVSFQRRWSDRAGSLFDRLRAEGVRTAAVYAAYLGAGGLEFASIDTSVDLDSSPATRMQFVEIHERLYEQRSRLQNVWLDARPWGLCTSARCVAQALEQELAERCDFKPLSWLLITARHDSPRPYLGVSSSLLRPCVIDGFIGRSVASGLESKGCGFDAREKILR